MTELELNSFYKKLGESIRIARIKAEIKQEAFAEFLNLSRVSIVNIEKGRQRPTIHLLYIIAKVLNIELVELLPQFKASDRSISEWKALISKQVKVTREEQGKLLGFIEEESKNLNLPQNAK